MLHVSLPPIVSQLVVVFQMCLLCVVVPHLPSGAASADEVEKAGQKVLVYCMSGITR